MELPPEVSKELMALVHKHLANRPDALNFLRIYCDYCHKIDDLVDVPEYRTDNEFLGDVLNTALEVFSSDFYATRRVKLYSLVKEIQNSYLDSVIAETNVNSPKWLKDTGDVLRCSAHAMTMAVVELVVTEETGDYAAGYKAKREISLLCRQNSYEQHHDSKGNPV